MSDQTGLQITDLTVRFGGIVAVDGVTLYAPRDRVTGLIGPNGAGKTTTFNACSGLVRPTEGALSLDGRDITVMSPARRAQLGLGRTFQRVEICASMTARENIALGCEALAAGASPLRQMFARRGNDAVIRAATDEAIELCGLSSFADRVASVLSTGQRRLLELGRVVAGGFGMLLLDEPSSGLDRTETEAFGEVLTEVVRERSTGVLLVEHDMDLVMEVCDHLFVLDFGQLIFEGTPAQTQRSDLVRRAYLGDEVA